MAKARGFLLTELLAHTLGIIVLENRTWAVSLIFFHLLPYADICNSDSHLFPHFVSNVIVNAGFQSIRKRNQVVNAWDHSACFI
jgi:hypothetical protein